MTSTAATASPITRRALGRVVPRWYAETCLVADLTVAAALPTAGLG